MKVFKVYNATTDGWLDWPQRTFYAHAVYGTAFSTYEEADGCTAVMEARWEGHRIQVIEGDLNTWSEQDEAEDQHWSDVEEFDPYEAAGESRFGLPGGGSL